MLATSQNDLPLNVMFLLSTMPVGGAETLLVNMVRKFDRTRIRPSVACLKHRDELGEVLASEIPVFDHLIRHKFDLAVVGRLRKLFRQEKVHAVVTVGAGDKMFWGRIAGYTAGVPVILSALHSTGWPDGVGKLNRTLTRITDGFIAVAQHHAEYQIQHERFPPSKVFLIPNGVDTQRFRFDTEKRNQWRERLNIPLDAPTISIVAALRPEKNHAMFLQIAANVLQRLPQAHFVIAGDGSLKPDLEQQARTLGIAPQVHFLGTVSDVVGVLSMSDLFTLTSKNEASPVSIMEALACERPVVAPSVGSIHETVRSGENGFLVEVDDIDQATERWLEILSNPELARSMGAAGRARVVEHCSLDSMTEGYTHLIESCFHRKTRPAFQARHQPAPARLSSG